MTDIVVSSRATYRKSVAEFLSTRMSSASAVVDHVPADLQGQTPIVCITGAPTNRMQGAADGSYENKFGLSARLITLYSLEGENAWTPAMAEDMIDQLEYELSLAIRQARDVQVLWRAISRNGTSVFEGPFKINGIAYLSEIVPLLVEVDD